MAPCRRIYRTSTTSFRYSARYTSIPSAWHSINSIIRVSRFTMRVSARAVVCVFVFLITAQADGLASADASHRSSASSSSKALLLRKNLRVVNHMHTEEETTEKLLRAKHELTTAEKVRAADPIFLAVAKGIALVANIANTGVTYKRIKDLRKTINSVGDAVHDVWIRRTEDCISFRSLEFEARLLGILSKMVVGSAADQFATNRAVNKVKEVAESGSLLDQRAIALAESFASGEPLGGTGKTPRAISDKMKENALQAVSVVQSMVDRTVHDVCYVDEASDEGDITTSFSDLSGELDDMSKKVVADIGGTIGSALDVMGDVSSLAKASIAATTMAQIDKLVSSAKTMLLAFKTRFGSKFQVVAATISFMMEAGLRVLVFCSKISNAHAQRVIEILQSVMTLEAQMHNKVDPAWLVGLSIADALLSIVDNFLRLISKVSLAFKEAFTYVTETINTLVSLIRLANNYYAASRQSQQNRALRMRAESLSVAYSQKYSWSTCRSLISIDHAMGNQHRMLKRYTSFLKTQGVTTISSKAMQTAMTRVFEEVCPTFAVGCSLIIDSKNLPVVVRKSIPKQLVSRIRRRVMYGPISDIAVAMSSEQARALLAIGYQQVGQYMFICRSCSGSVIMDMTLLGGETDQDSVEELKTKLKKESIKGISVHIQILRKIFGKGERPLKFLQIPLTELAKTDEEILVDVASDFMQIPFHLTTYSRAWYTLGIKYDEKITEVTKQDGEFAKVYEQIGYTPMGHGVVDDRSLIEAFDGRCLDDEKKNSCGKYGGECSFTQCVEWPYFYMLGKLRASLDKGTDQQASKPFWLGKYIVPDSMAYARPKEGTINRHFDATVVTYGFGCRYNQKLLNVGKIIHTNPTCYHSVEMGHSKSEPVRWDVWLVDTSDFASLDEWWGDFESNKAPMPAFENELKEVIRVKDCHLVNFNSNFQDAINDRSTLMFGKLADGILDASIVDVFSGPTGVQDNTCNKEKMRSLSPLHMNHEIAYPQFEFGQDGFVVNVRLYTESGGRGGKDAYIVDAMDQEGTTDNDIQVKEITKKLEKANADLDQSMKNIVSDKGAQILDAGKGNVGKMGAAAESDTLKEIEVRALEVKTIENKLSEVVRSRTEPDVIDLEALERTLEGSIFTFRSHLAEQLVTNKACSFGGDSIETALQTKTASALWRDSHCDQQECTAAQQITKRGGIDWKDNSCSKEALDVELHKRKVGAKEFTLKELHSKLGLAKKMWRRDPALYTSLDSTGTWCNSKDELVKKEGPSCLVHMEYDDFFCPEKGKLTSESEDCGFTAEEKKSKPLLEEPGWLRSLWDNNCDFRAVFDVTPELTCPDAGTGVVLGLDQKHTLIERCSSEGPFVHRYRLEVVFGHDGNVDMQTANWARKTMLDDGFQMAHFDSVSYSPKIRGSVFVFRRMLRQRVWIQPDPRMTDIRIGGWKDTAEETGVPPLEQALIHAGTRCDWCKKIIVAEGHKAPPQCQKCR